MAKDTDIMHIRHAILNPVFKDDSLYQPNITQIHNKINFRWTKLSLISHALIMIRSLQYFKSVLALNITIRPTERFFIDIGQIIDLIFVYQLIPILWGESYRKCLLGV